MLISLLALALTTPEVTLSGIVVARSGRHAATLVSEGRERPVLAGDRAFGCDVTAILRDRVELTCAGERRTLTLSAAPTRAAAPNTPAPVAESAPSDVTLTRSELEARLDREMSRLMTETTLRWLDECSHLRFTALRYFNACGAEPKFGIGEEHEPETHLIPLIFRAIRTGQPLTVFGQDYPTIDGTCIRDYVHVSDLATAHEAALNSLLHGGPSGIFNAGTGSGFSVLQVIQAAERITGRKVPYTLGPRRDGDSAELVADSSKLQKTLGWKPRYDTMESMVASAWAFDAARHGAL